VINAEIRTLLDAAARERRPVDADAYRQLVVEWARLVEAERAPAAA
jgi:hypothetical protein